MEEYRIIIGLKLKEYRLKKGYSQRDLAKLSKVSDSAISYYENGRSIDIDVLDKLCRALNIDMFDFLNECRKSRI